MEPAIGRFTSVDPHAENYYSWSPYVYVGNNPIKRTDLTGMDWFIFDANSGAYTKGRVGAEGVDRMVVKNLDEKGNVKHTFYDFNDPKSDVESIENGEIDRFEQLSDDVVKNIINESGVTEENVFSRWTYALRESNANNLSGTGKMDFRTYPSIAGTNSLYIRKGTAYNASDAGNFLWGYAMRVMGFSLMAARSAAQANAWWSAKESNGEGSQNPNSIRRWFENRSWLGDSKEDQRAIQKGMQDAGSYWKYKINTIKKLWK